MVEKSCLEFHPLDVEVTEHYKVCGCCVARHEEVVYFTDEFWVINEYYCCGDGMFT